MSSVVILVSPELDQPGISALVQQARSITEATPSTSVFEGAPPPIGELEIAPQQIVSSTALPGAPPTIDELAASPENYTAPHVGTALPPSVIGALPQEQGMAFPGSPPPSNLLAGLSGTETIVSAGVPPSLEEFAAAPGGPPSLDQITGFSGAQGETAIGAPPSVSELGAASSAYESAEQPEVSSQPPIVEPESSSAKRKPTRKA